MKLVKDLFKIILFVLIVYTPMFIFSLMSEFRQIEENINRSRQQKLAQIKNTIQDLLEQDRVLEACQKLKAEQSSLNLATFTVISTEGNCAYPFNFELPPIENKELIQPVKVNGQLLLFIKQKTRETDWALSISPKVVSLFTGFDSDFDFVLLKSILTSFLQVIYIVLIFVFLAVLILTKSIQNQYRKNGRDPVWLRVINKTFGWLQLQDLKILQLATSASLKKSQDLAKDRDLLETSLEYSIFNEIRLNNKNIPYTFSGTVAKVDINGFSKVVSAGYSKEVQNMTHFLEEFGCELLLRYQGLFEKTVGDEIVAVFKTVDSTGLAAAFARDLMQEFSRMTFNIELDQRSFTLKSSISNSELTFSKRPSGYGFSGDALTFTSRLLDVVTIKDRNILSCLKSEAHHLQDIVVIPSELKSFEFKNMGSQQGYLVDTFVQLNDIYSKSSELIKFFRSNEALIYLLEKIQTENDFEKLNLIFNHFCSFEVRQTNSVVIATWIQTIKIFEKRVYQDPKYAFSFSRLIIEGSRLIPTSQWNASCTDAVVSISRYLEGRINASVVDVLIEKDLNIIAIEHEKSFLIESDQSFRTRGNLLINQAILELSNSTFERVIKMIQSNTLLESSTGIYCACRIIIHYRKVNPAELETFVSYRQLSDLLHDLYLNKKSAISPRLLKLLDLVNSYSELTYKEAH